MDRTIYKYSIPVKDEQAIAMPPGATILTAQLQRDEICLWAMVDPKLQPTTFRHIRVIGTGHPISEVDLVYIATVQSSGGSLVFHVFEKP